MKPTIQPPDDTDRAQFARIMQETSNIAYIYGWLLGDGATDTRPGRDRDRLEAERVMHSLGWELRDIAQRVDDLRCGAIKVPRPWKEVAARKPTSSSGASPFGSSNPLAGWLDTVRNWRFIPRRFAAPEEATPEQAKEWIAYGRSLCAQFPPGPSALGDVLRAAK